MTPKEQYDAFLEHARSLTTKLTPKRSSLKPLLDILQAQLKKKAVPLDEKAVKKALGTSKRLIKYQPAIDILMNVWGTDQDYVIPKPSAKLRDSAMTPALALLGEEEDTKPKPLKSVKEMSCHTWALSGTIANGANVNLEFSKLTDKLGPIYDYGYDLKGKKLSVIRQEFLDSIVEQLAEERTDATDHEVWICAGFREGAVCPEHFWLEDHTAQKTYDTFIDQDVRMIPKVGQRGKAFKPPCEGSAFEADEIFRVRKDGYTHGQFTSLPKK